MLGNIVVRFMSLVLNITGILAIIGGTIAGGYMGAENEIPFIAGAIGGLIVSFLFVVITCGMAFLMLEINNNLIRLNDKMK